MLVVSIPDVDMQYLRLHARKSVETNDVQALHIHLATVETCISRISYKDLNMIAQESTEKRHTFTKRKRKETVFQALVRSLAIVH